MWLSQQQDVPRIIGGDFNAITNIIEKQGG